MAKVQKKEAKRRIFDSAVCLFARKGYAAVGIREIAKTAKVNISMINYYYGGKVGILKAIINECNEKYYRAVTDVEIKGAPPKQYIREIIHSLVTFYRKNAEIAIVACNIVPIDVPEILGLKTKWVVEYRERLNKFYKQLSLNTRDAVQMSFIRGMLTTIVQAHFTHRYFYEHVMQVASRLKYLKKNIIPVAMLKYDDTYYDRFTEMLTNFYLYGLNGIIPKK